MNLLKRTFASVVILLALTATPRTAAQTQPPEPQGEFIPIDQLPPQDQLPAAPLLIGAYVFVLAALSIYLLSVARRLTAVQREVDRLENELKRSGRA